MTKATQTEAIDGRRQRSERSRQAIIQAAVAFMEEGVLVPTAQQIAERAGVGIRSFFRHFEDMGALAEAVNGQLGATWKDLFTGGDREGTLNERLTHAIERHADAYEQIGNVMLSTAAQRWRYEFLRQNYARALRGLRQNLSDWMPELNALPSDDREAVDALASFEMWHRLREHQGLSKKTSTRIVIQLIRPLVPDP